jgi:Glycosyl-transferase for dystroglycan
MPMLRTPRRHEEILTHRTTSRNNNRGIGDSESDSCFDVQEDPNGRSNSNKNAINKGIHLQANSSAGRASPAPSPLSGNSGGVFCASSSSPSSFNNPPRQRRRIRKREHHAWKTVAQAMTAMLSLLTIMSLFLGVWTESSGPHANAFRKMVNRPVFHKLSMDAPTSCSKELTVNDVSFTLVTQVSSDRLWMMEQQCRRWNYNNETFYPISLAVFTNDTTANVQLQLRQLGCDVDNVVAVQTLSAKLFPYDDYPVNILRNLALKAVQTSHVVYIDIDFWISQDLPAALQLPEVMDLLAQDPKATLVIPAFMLLRQCKQWRVSARMRTHSGTMAALFALHAITLSKTQ